MATERLDALWHVYDKYLSESPVKRFAWLFKQNAALLTPGPIEWKDRRELLDQERMKSVDVLYGSGNLNILLELVTETQEPWTVGFSIGKSTFIVDKGPLLSAFVGNDDEDLRTVGLGMLAGMESERPDWVRALTQTSLFKEGGDLVKADILLSMPFEQATWEMASEQGKDVSSLYWRQVRYYGRGNLKGTDLGFILKTLLAHGRVIGAVDFVSLHLDDEKEVFTPHEIVELLEALVTEVKANGSNCDGVLDDIPRLLDRISRDDSQDIERRARLEWWFLPLFEHSQYEPKTLHAALEHSPSFFSELLTSVYKGRNEEAPEQSDDDLGRSEAAYALLESWRSIPGGRWQGRH